MGEVISRKMSEIKLRDVIEFPESNDMSTSSRGIPISVFPILTMWYLSIYPSITTI